MKSATCVNAFESLTDAKLGGQSTATLAFRNDDDEDGYLAFEGNFSSEIPQHANPKVRRLGQASFASKVWYSLQFKLEWPAEIHIILWKRYDKK